jgi:hypothetical protein
MPAAAQQAAVPDRSCFQRQKVDFLRPDGRISAGMSGFLKQP